MGNTPPYLKQNDKVAILATARKVNEEELRFGMETLARWGLQPVLGKNLYAAQNQFGGSDEQRAEDLQWAIDDDSIRAIFFGRGGYGMLRVVDKVNFDKLKANPKWIVGYSDATVLHAHVHTCLTVASLHATMLNTFDKNEEATESIRRCLFGEKIKYEFSAEKLNRMGAAYGEVIGGNISLLYALAASPEDINTTGKILFLEDIDEYLYHLDRMMLNLKRSGKLKNLAGLIIGGLTDMKDNAIPFGKTALEIIYDTVKEYSYPLCFGFPAGHIERNLALYFGKEAKLTVSKEGSSLEYL